MKIFLATALEQQALNERRLVFELRERLDEKYGSSATFLAAYEFPTPDKYLAPRASLDLVVDLLEQTDVFVLYFPHKVFSGALLELGWALALGKPCLALTATTEILPYMLRGGADGLVTALIPNEAGVSRYFEAICDFINQNVAQ